MHEDSRRGALRLGCFLLPLLALGACRTSGTGDRDDAPAAGSRVSGTRGDWRAELVLDRGTVGIWRVGAVPFLPRFGTPEVIALDDAGRCSVVVPYSGKWTALTAVEDGRWLGALACGDVDPRVPDAELYVGGQAGNLYQVVGHASGPLAARLIARFPGEELHTLVAGVLDPRVEGGVLLAFTSPGGLYRLQPTGVDGGFESELLEPLAGRVRDALVLSSDAEGTRLATASRDGRVAILNLGADGATWDTIHDAPMGAGRLAMAPARADRGTVLYSTRDDGRVLRHEESSSGTWSTETIYVGPQGPRGLAAGRFTVVAGGTEAVESVAVFGYSSEVVVLSRDGAAWRAETIFVDRDKGHWLEAAELDGRNGTDELLATGYGGRVVLLARPPGYGLPPGAALAK